MAEEQSNKAPEQETHDAPEGLESVLAELGPGEWKVAIHRHDRNGVEWLDTWLAEAFSLAAVKDVYGGGKYRFRILTPEGQYHTSRVERISGRSRYPDREEEEEEHRPNGTDVAESVLKLTERLDGFMHDLRHPEPEFQRVNPLELLTNMVGMVQEASRPMYDLLATRASEEREEQMGAIQGFLQGIEFARTIRAEMQEEASPSSPYEQVLKRLGDPLVRILERNMGPGAGAALAPTANPNPPENLPMIDAEKLPDPAPAWVRYVGQILPQLVGWAERGKAPGVCAEFVVDELQPGHWRPVLSELTREGFETEFYAAVPKAAENRDWFGDFYGAAQDILLELLRGGSEPEAGEEVGAPEG